MDSMEVINKISEHENCKVYVKHKGKYHVIKEITNEPSELLSNTWMTIIEVSEMHLGV